MRKQEKGSETIWIDKSSHLIRKIDERKDYGKFQTESTTLYEAVIDAEVANELLEFNPPKK